MRALQRFVLPALVASMIWTVPAAMAGSKSGAYLAGRAALQDSDFSSAASFFSRALVLDPGNLDLMEDLSLIHISEPTRPY